MSIAIQTVVVVSSKAPSVENGLGQTACDHPTMAGAFGNPAGPAASNGEARWCCCVEMGHRINRQLFCKAWRATADETAQCMAHGLPWPVARRFLRPVQMENPMQDDLLFLFQQLRKQLDVAYAAPMWDGPRIDHITRDLLAVERSLAAEGVFIPRGCVAGIAPAVVVERTNRSSA